MAERAGESEVAGGNGFAGLYNRERPGQSPGHRTDEGET